MSFPNFQNWKFGLTVVNIFKSVNQASAQQFRTNFEKCSPQQFSETDTYKVPLLSFCSSTDNTTSPWWEVDLQVPVKVAYVDIFIKNYDLFNERLEVSDVL